ncbi:UNVERIFIED_CONTAM: hypothetical protein RMT77_002792 [Armadillidium vulgare]
MKSLVLRLFLIQTILFLFVHSKSISSDKNYGNPDEWGPYFQGDMRFPEGRVAIRDERYKWPNATVPYKFSDDFDEYKHEQVVKAAKELSDLTGGCIKFVPKTDQDVNYVLFVDYREPSEECWSYVGRVTGKQQLHLSDRCMVSGIIQHEMLHALGVFHEQSRPDRDEFVIIHHENIYPGTERNFEKYDTNVVDTYGLPYDYLSVMHYSQYAFSKNGKITIETKDPNYQTLIGRRLTLSSLDIQKIKKHYNC